MGLLDGSISAIHPDTGDTVWRYDSGSPMVSVQSPDTLVSGDTTTPTFFPGADGGLYHYNKIGGQLEVCTSAYARPLHSLCAVSRALKTVTFLPFEQTLWFLP